MKKGVWVWVGIGALAALVVAGALWTSRDGSIVPGAGGLGDSARTDGSGGSAGATMPGVGGRTRSGGSMMPTRTPQTPTPPTVAEPVPAGSKLVTITTPPPRTLGFIDAAGATPDSTYTVEFRVYGVGPGAPGTTVVIAVDRSVPEPPVPMPYDLNGRNVLAKLTFEARRVVTVGGAYTGHLVLRAREGVLEPWLVDAEAR